MKRVGILGTGAIARFHAHCWQQLPVELAAHFDLDQSAAIGFSHDFGGTAYSELDAFFAAVDIVDICTPASAHKANVLAAAAAGKAIVCEKPLARHLADCEEIVAAVEAAAVPFFVAHVVRFFPQFAAAKAAIDSGQIGRPGVMRTVRAGGFPRSFGKNSDYSNFEKSGGVILDVAIHDIDYQRWCCGEVERVFAQGRTFGGDLTSDHALITLRFESGAIGHIETSWAHPPNLWRNRIEVAGDQGLLEWDSMDRQPITAYLKDPATGADTAPENYALEHSSPTAPQDNPYFAELAHFLDSLESGEPFRVTAHDALMAVKVSLAAIESVRTGEPITIANFQEAAA